MFSIVFALSIIYNISSLLSEAIINTAEALVKRENILLFKRAFNNKNTLGIDVNDLIIVHKNSSDEIVTVDFKIDDCERIMMSIIEGMNDGTNMISTDGYILDIPLGYMTNSPLLLNLGPKIPVKINTTDIALGSVSTSVREFGINNALIEIYISIEIETNTILPLKSGTSKEVYKILVASKIISGKVPDFYGGHLSKESDTFNLPIM